MPDFLDALITRARDGERGLAPRTPSMFEPTPAVYGPGGGPRPSRGFEPPDAMEAPIEERSVPAESDQSLQRRGVVGATPARRAAGRLTDPLESVAPATASQGDDRPPRVANRGQEADRTGPAERAAPGSAEPGTHELQPASRATAARTLTPISPGAEEASLPGVELRARAGTSRSRRRISQPLEPVDSEALGLADRPGSSGSLLPSDSRSAEVPNGPLTRLGAELQALRGFEPAATNPGRTLGAPLVIKTVDPTAQSPLGSGSAPAPTAPRYIQVSIGQVEVRAAPAAAATSPRPRPAAGSVPTGLDEYLRRRNGGAA